MAFEELAKEYLPLNLKYDVEHLLAIKKSSNEAVFCLEFRYSPTNP